MVVLRLLPERLNAELAIPSNSGSIDLRVKPGGQGLFIQGTINEAFVEGEADWTAPLDDSFGGVYGVKVTANSSVPDFRDFKFLAKHSTMPDQAGVKSSSKVSVWCCPISVPRIRIGSLKNGYGFKLTG